MGKMERFNTTETDTNVCDPKRKRRSDGLYNYGQEDKTHVKRHPIH